MKFLRKNGILIVATTALVFLTIYGDDMGPEEHDAFCNELIAKGKSEEALTWSREASDDIRRTIYEFDNARSAQIIEEIYELGALKVMAVDIDSEPDIGETTDTLIVTLPDEPSKRASLLRYENRLARWTGMGGTADRGQKYMLLWWD